MYYIDYTHDTRCSVKQFIKVKLKHVSNKIGDGVTKVVFNLMYMHCGQSMRYITLVSSSARITKPDNILIIKYKQKKWFYVLAFNAQKFLFIFQQQL